uniref:Uncharacterized protein n=1 Tax=Solanum tuberosum TaxID=4113 RepID=M1DF59_SOLTU
MPNYGRERLNSRFSITMHIIQYLELNNSRTQGVNDTTHLKNARLGEWGGDGGSCRIMGMNYSTQGLNNTSYLKTARLIGFMRNYGHDYSTQRPSWVTCSSPMIRNIISKRLKLNAQELRTWRYYSSQRYSTDGVHTEVMGMNDSTQRSK